MSKFCKMLKDANKDEAEGHRFYGKLKKSAPREIRGLIDRIQHDEQTHHKMIKRFQKEYCP